MDLTKRPSFYFEPKVEIPRIKIGKKQTLGTLIIEEPLSDTFMHLFFIQHFMEPSFEGEVIGGMIKPEKSNEISEVRLFRELPEDELVPWLREIMAR